MTKGCEALYMYVKCDKEEQENKRENESHTQCHKIMRKMSGL